MKARKIYSSTLLAVLGVSTLGAPLLASAEATSLTSKGSVKVEEGTAGGEDTKTVDPENPGENLPDPDPDSPKENKNPDTGTLVIERTTDLNFGTIKTSANDVEAFAEPVTFNDKAKTRGAYVQWADVRAGGTYGYTVTAELTKQFTSGENVLKGSLIDFSNGLIASQTQDNDATAASKVVPSNVQTSFTLSESSGAQTVVTAAKEEKEGKGRLTMEFGQSKDYKTQGEEAATDDKSVKLTVPAATATDMVKGDYEAEVTWKIVAAE
ncbi:WxL domain-containing protein [Vagococcus sp. CY53-2]|uniref:WxL domain-containing protein n=1 Tax=Vagococcus sp. CY53-2 TaxID=2925780 RepID=UPI001F50E06B|nr:WxL domain-containing protein [Vagococcus sp. CY53-2]MCI0129704.1 WxL domain-containing protein [Vagococcus sp. CY53-2]